MSRTALHFALFLSLIIGILSIGSDSFTSGVSASAASTNLRRRLDLITDPLREFRALSVPVSPYVGYDFPDPSTVQFVQFQPGISINLAGYPNPASLPLGYPVNLIPSYDASSNTITDPTIAGAFAYVLDIDHYSGATGIDDSNPFANLLPAGVTGSYVIPNAEGGETGEASDAGSGTDVNGTTTTPSNTTTPASTSTNNGGVGGDVGGTTGVESGAGVGSETTSTGTVTQVGISPSSVKNAATRGSASVPFTSSLILLSLLFLVYIV